jgi:uncharacterized protein YeaO (DUF488 family)
MARLQLTTFRIGDPTWEGDALRIATTRRPPRGVPKSKWHELFDLWLPAVAPSTALLGRAHASDFEDAAAWTRFVRAYTREMSQTEARQTIALLAAVARQMPIAIGCYCEDETRCHRSVLRQLIIGSD